MSEQPSNTMTMPGKSLSIKSGSMPSTGANLTVGAVAVDFESVKHLMSKRPLRAPRRQTPKKS
jgi:hypothetical protein